MCEYCDGNKKLNYPNDTLELYIVKSSMFGTYTIDDNYTGDYSEPINFCPMCGRKLTESKEE